jgi:hypothetical protein
MMDGGTKISFNNVRKGKVYCGSDGEEDGGDEVDADNNLSTVFALAV